MSDVLLKLQKIFNSTFDTENSSITMNTVPDDVEGWDSLGHVTLASNIEQEFHVNLDVDELMEMENVGSIVRILEGKLGDPR
jgi:acyl carrier protein